MNNIIMNTIVPPIKCQGIKTKIVPTIYRAINRNIDGYWIEPFCGSCVVALNVQPLRARLFDTNIYIINLYRSIQNGTINAGKVRLFLELEGKKLALYGEKYYYEVRERFNEIGDPLDFLFLNRSCFNGVMRFNRKGKFNVPFGHKPERFRQAYITKITNQVRAFSEVIEGKDWIFEVKSFEESLTETNEQDFVYADPPYLGRHLDYYNSWSQDEDEKLNDILKSLPCRFLLSTWHSNKYRINPYIFKVWNTDQFDMTTIEHFYHVGSTENLRNSMTEAIISNYPLDMGNQREIEVQQTMLEL